MTEQADPIEFGPPAGEGWLPSVPSWERSVVCPGECGYMAIETWKRGRVIGICTKCGHTWTPEEKP